MVTFGGYRLQHVSAIQTVGSRIIHDRLVPSARSFSYRSDETSGGRVITVSGQIRGDPDHVLRLEELRVRADDVARALDLGWIRNHQRETWECRGYMGRGTRCRRRGLPSSLLRD